MTFEILAQAVINGILMGFVFALVAVGLSLILGVAQIINFAHGEFLMLGMYTAFWMWALFRLDPLVSLPISIGALGLLGVCVYKLINKIILDAPRLTQIFTTFGLSIFLRSMAQFLWSPNSRMVQNSLVGDLRVAHGKVNVGAPQLVAAAGAVLAYRVSHWLVDKTEIGRAMMATAEDRDAASLMGINTEQMYTLAWAVGSACVGLAGGLLTTFYPVEPNIGLVFGTTASVVIALGGFGSIKGAFAAGIIVGLIQVVGGFLIGPAFKFAVVLVVYLLVVAIRPQGLLGKY